MDSPKKLIVVDFDNTLFFTDGAAILAYEELHGSKIEGKQLRKLPKPVKVNVYKLGYSKYRDFSVPNNKLIKRLAMDSDAKVVILTARINDSHPHVKYLLKKHNVPISRIIYRLKKDLKMGDEQWKLGKLVPMMKRYEKVEIFEDKLDNIMHFKQNIASKNASFFLVREGSIKKIK